jgi:hypothetical protein
VTATPRRARRPPRRRRPALATALAVGGAVVAFLVGVALGQALDENAPPGGTQTIVRTLKPLPLPPAARETVTVTTGAR